MVRILRHRQTKGPDSARPHLNRCATPRLHPVSSPSPVADGCALFTLHPLHHPARLAYREGPTDPSNFSQSTLRHWWSRFHPSMADRSPPFRTRISLAPVVPSLPVP